MAAEAAEKTTKLVDMVAVKLEEPQVLEHLVVKLLQVDILESAVTLPMMVAAEVAAGTVLVQPAGKQPQLPVIVGTIHLALLAVLVMSTPLLQLKIILTDV